MVLFAYGAGTLFGVRTCLAVPMQKRELFAVPAVDYFFTDPFMIGHRLMGVSWILLRAARVLDAAQPHLLT